MKTGDEPTRATIAPHSVRTFLLGKLCEYGLPMCADEAILATRVSETGLDSLDLMELLTDIEEQYGIRVEDDTVSPATKVEDLIGFILRKSAGGST